MKIIMQLLQTRIIKIAAFFLVIYFGLFANKEHPDSLGNRLSGDNIKKNFNEAQQKSHFILSQISAVKNIDKNNISQNLPQENLEKIVVENIAEGSGDKVLKCGDKAEISYEIKNLISENVLEKISQEIIIGSNENFMLENKIIGMKVGGVRIINIARDFKSNNKKLEFMLKFNEANLQYKVTLLKITEQNLQNNCYE